MLTGTVRAMQDRVHHGQLTTEEAHGCLPERYHVAVVLGKKLIRDQITVEYASRVRALVEYIATGNTAVDLVFFSGGKQDDGFVSEAVAGYTYFRQLCERCTAVDLTSIAYHFDEEASNTILNIQNLVIEMRRRLKGTTKQCHSTLFTNDYHVKRIKEIHQETPDRSLLTELEQTGNVDFVEAPYPFLDSSDPVTNWLGRINLLRDESTCVRANLEGILMHSVSALSQGNLCTLERVIEGLQSCCLSAPQDAGNNNVAKALKTVRESVLQLIECRDALQSPAPNTNYRVTIRQALDYLLIAHRSIRRDINPDRPLQWGE